METLISTIHKKVELIEVLNDKLTSTCDAHIKPKNTLDMCTKNYCALYQCHGQKLALGYHKDQKVNFGLILQLIQRIEETKSGGHFKNIKSSRQLVISILDDLNSNQITN